MLRAMFFGFVVGVVVSPQLQDFATDGSAGILERMREALHTDAYDQISRVLNHG
jgi:hypothetical protein